MNQKEKAKRFEENRGHLRAVAYRMLGALTEAEDAVQEAWLRFSRTDTGGIDNSDGWLTTVTARICLDMLRARHARREESWEAQQKEPTSPRYANGDGDPESEALLADAVGHALLVVLNKLTPPERIAFVLHDMFDLSFDEIAPVVNRSLMATRQLASRARRRVRGAETDVPADLANQRSVVDAFLAASRGGDFAALLSLLSPEVVFRADQTAVRAGGAAEVRGAEAVARLFSGRAQAAKPALVDGSLGVVVAPKGQLFLVLLPTIENGHIVSIEAVGDPARLRQFALSVLDGA